MLQHRNRVGRRVGTQWRRTKIMCAQTAPAGLNTLHSCDRELTVDQLDHPPSCPQFCSRFIALTFVSSIANLVRSHGFEDGADTSPRSLKNATNVVCSVSIRGTHSLLNDLVLEASGHRNASLGSAGVAVERSTLS